MFEELRIYDDKLEDYVLLNMKVESVFALYKELQKSFIFIQDQNPTDSVSIQHYDGTVYKFNSNFDYSTDLAYIAHD